MTKISVHIIKIIFRGEPRAGQFFEILNIGFLKYYKWAAFLNGLWNQVSNEFSKLEPDSVTYFAHVIACHTHQTWHNVAQTNTETIISTIKAPL